MYRPSLLSIDIEIKNGDFVVIFYVKMLRGQKENIFSNDWYYIGSQESAEKTIILLYNEWFIFRPDIDIFVIDFFQIEIDSFEPVFAVV